MLSLWNYPRSSLCGYFLHYLTTSSCVRFLWNRFVLLHQKIYRTLNTDSSKRPESISEKRSHTDSHVCSSSCTCSRFSLTIMSFLLLVLFSFFSLLLIVFILQFSLILYGLEDYLSRRKSHHKSSTSSQRSVYRMSSS